MYAGTAVGPYQIVRQLGAGGMGVVWLAEDSRLHRKVALKTVKTADADTSEGRQRLMREARAAAALNHPHIAAVHDVLDIDGNVIVVFEYVEGDTLAARLQRGPMSVTEVVEISWQLADALAAAHAQGVVHRDLKPSNVVLGPDGRAKVLDFGIARLVPAGADLSASQPGTVGVGLVGTPGYAAPEQYLSRNVDGRADLYALGVMIYEMITGRRPFPGTDAVLLATAVLRDDAPPMTSSGLWVPPKLEALVARLLQRDPNKRPSSGDEVLIELSPVRDTESSPLARRTVLLRRRVPTSTMVVAAVAIAVVAGVILRLQWKPAPAGTSAASPVIAVLPLTNMSGDASNDYLGAGLAESLITSLASVPAVTVLSRSAVEESRQQNPDRASFVSALDASYVVTGSVQSVADRLRVTLNLERPDASVAWGQTVEGPTRDLFTLQTQLARLLTDAINEQRPSAERPTPAAPSTTSEPAQLAYWKGRAYLDQRDQAGNIQGAIKEFETALAADPRFAIAHAGLADAQWAMYVQTNDKTWAEKAVESTRAALSLEPDRPSLRYTAGLTLFRSGRYEEARQELERAVALQPTSEDATRLLGRVLMRQGNIDEGMVQFKKALAIRPKSVAVYTDMGLALYSASRYREALDAFEMAIAISPNSSASLTQAGAASQMAGDNRKALEFYERATAIQPRAETFSSMGTIYYGQGEYDKAARAYEAALLIRPLGAITHRNLGDAYRRLGRRDDARRAYREAIARAEAEVSVSPSDARAVARLAVYKAKAGDDAGARRTLRQAEQLAPKDEQVQLRAGVVHALAGRTTAALDAIERAIAGGVAPRLIAIEEDFEKLRPLPRFAALVANPAEEKR
ncbi:MAG: tetratricopeptide repeat protein [Acidobacteriota bacterium]|nr:tetratricopeptide repeat protein [Acidobacteriota bacterium]